MRKFTRITALIITIGALAAVHTIGAKEVGSPLLQTLNWFPVHYTSMSSSNQLISSDNKGYAAYLWERTDQKVTEEDRAKSEKLVRILKEGCYTAEKCDWLKANKPNYW